MSDTCRWCGGPAEPAFETTDRNQRLSDRTFHYARCPADGTLSLTDPPDDLSVYYPASYYGHALTREQLAEQAEQERYRLDMLRAAVPPGRVIEVGSGTGKFSLLAHDAGYDVTALEMDDEGVRILRDVIGVDAVSTQDPTAALGDQDEADAIVAWHVVEHMHEPRRLLDAATAKLRPGGALVIAMPNPDSFQMTTLGKLWAHVDAPRHLALVRLPAITEYLRGAGLELESSTTVDPGALGCNLFGWSESFSAYARGREPLLTNLRRVGFVVSKVTAPIERRGGRGTTFTAVFRRPR
jgi:SAM-dependent methyltransferase